MVTVTIDPLNGAKWLVDGVTATVLHFGPCSSCPVATKHWKHVQPLDNDPTHDIVLSQGDMATAPHECDYVRLADGTKVIVKIADGQEIVKISNGHVVVTCPEFAALP